MSYLNDYWKVVDGNHSREWLMNKYEYTNWGSATKRATRERAKLDQPHSGDVTTLKLPVIEPEIVIRGEKSIAVWNDTHHPYHDKGCISTTENCLLDLQPDYLVYNGDILDWWQLSDFDKDPNRMNTVQDDIDEVIKMFERHAKLFPNTQKFFIMGNHEDRMRRYSWRHAKELASLRNMKIENLLRLGDYNMPLTEYKEPLPIKAKDRWGNNSPVFLITHGEIIRKHSSYTAKAEMENWGGSGMSGHCFSSDTEILTKRGWLNFKDLMVGDIALTYNTDNENTEWQTVKDTVCYSDYKEMVHFKSTAVDLLVTPEHAVVYKPRYEGRKIYKDTAKSRIGLRTDMPNAGNNINKDAPYSDDLIKLFAWVITEGCYEGSAIRIAQSNKPKVGVSRIEEICDRLNQPYTTSLRYKAGETNHGTHRNYDAYRIYLPKTDITEQIKTLFPLKQMNDIVLSFSARQFEIFFNEVILADGCKNSDATRSYQYATKYKSEVDIMQAACAMNSLRATFVPRKTLFNGKSYICYAVTINTRGWSSVGGGGKLVPYEGKVYCCTVDNHTLFVRRNGKVVIAGNTHRRGMCCHKDYFGEYAWWENGCMCNLKQGYISYPNWQQMSSIIYFNDNHFDVKQLNYINGKIRHGSKEYK